MIVLPLNEEAKSGRRPPWVTLILVAACLVVFLYNGTSDREVDAATDAALEDAWAYFEAHPYIQVDDDMAEMLGEHMVVAARDAFHLQLQASGSPGIPEFVRRHDQLEFESRVEAVYDAMEGHSFYRLGFFPEAMAAPDASFLTYVLVHEDWIHLLSNLMLVLLAGLFLEEVWGAGLFLIFIALGAVAGAGGYATLDPDAGEALGGASGVAAALAGAFLVRFGAVAIRFQYFVIPPFGGKFTARGWVLLPIYGGLYFALDYLLTHGAPGIEPVATEFATWAHVGGMTLGVGFALLMKMLRIEERFINPKIEEKMTVRSNPTLDRALEAREAGRLEEAAELLASEVARHPDDRDAALAYWDAATAVGRPEQAADALLRVLRDEVTSAGQGELAVQHWRELTQRAPDFPVDAAIEAKVAATLLEQQEHDLARFSMGRVLDGNGGAPRGAVAHKIARMAQDLDTDLARRAAEMALTAPDLDPGERPDVEALVQQLTGVQEREVAAEVAAEEANGTSSPLFGSGLDFDPEATSPGEATSPEDPSAIDPGLLDGDALNAEPFELDDLTAPPGVQNYDLDGDIPDLEGSEVSASERTSPGLAASDSSMRDLSPSELSSPEVSHSAALPLEDATSPSGSEDPAAAELSGSEAIPLEDDPDGPSSLDLSGSSHAGLGVSMSGNTAEPRMASTAQGIVGSADEPEEDLSGISIPPADDAPLHVDTEPDPLGDSTSGSLGDSAVSGDTVPSLEPEEDPMGQSIPSLGDTRPGGEASFSPTVDAHGERTGSPAVARDPDEIPLADETQQPQRHRVVDDTGAPDFGTTIDMSALGAETIPGYDIDAMDVEPIPIEPRSQTAPEIRRPDLSVPVKRTIKKMEAIPLGIGDGAVTLDVGERGKAQLGLERIDAISVAGVRGLRPKPVVVIDLVTNWLGEAGEPLKIVRFRSDRFDPCNLVPGEENGFKALKDWIGQLLEASEAVPLPDPSSAVGSPFQMFENLSEYEREVLRVL